MAQRSAEAAKEIRSLISASVERVEQGTSLVDQATQQNAALAEQSAAAAETLKQQAQRLVQAVAVFKLAQGSQTPRAAMPAAKP